MYDFFGDIVCINLDISTERRKHAQDIFDKYKIPAKFFTAKKHPKGGLYGCFHSHIEILKDAYERDIDHLLVFEDDFLPTDAFSEEKLGNAIEFMKTNKDWDIMYFGYSSIKDDIDFKYSSIFDAKICTKDIAQYNPFFTHSLCYSKKAIKSILESYEDYIGIIHYDVFIANHLSFKNYCVIPMIFDQNYYFQHNNESQDPLEFIFRTLFPLLAVTQLNYKLSCLTKQIHQNRFRINIYLFITAIAVFLYCLRKSLTFKK